MSKREELIITATTLFAHRGYDAVGVQSVADEVGVTKPTLYHYFKNKRGLVEAIFDYWGSPLMEELHQAARYEGDLIATLARVRDTKLKFAEQYRPFTQLSLTLEHIGEEHELYTTASSFFDIEHRLMGAIFSHATLDHGNMTGRDALYGLLFQSMTNGLVRAHLQSRIVVDEELVDRALKHFMHGIFS